MIQNKKIIASILFLLISFVSTPQTAVSELPPPAPPPPPGLPVDAGVYFLLAFGLVYGVVKTLRSRA